MINKEQVQKDVIESVSKVFKNLNTSEVSINNFNLVDDNSYFLELDLPTIGYFKVWSLYNKVRVLIDIDKLCDIYLTDIYTFDELVRYLDSFEKELESLNNIRKSKVYVTEESIETLNLLRYRILEEFSEISSEDIELINCTQIDENLKIEINISENGRFIFIINENGLDIQIRSIDIRYISDLNTLSKLQSNLVNLKSVYKPNKPKKNQKEMTDNDKNTIKKNI